MKKVRFFSIPKKSFNSEKTHRGVTSVDGAVFFEDGFQLGKLFHVGVRARMFVRVERHLAFLRLDVDGNDFLPESARLVS